MNELSERATQRKPFEVMLDQERIAQRVRELADEINRDYAGREPVLIGVLKGCIVFLADLIRHLTLPVELDFISAASYRAGTTAGPMALTDDVTIPLRGRDVLVVEGIVDTGRTISRVLEHLQQQEPASVEVVTLLDKPGSHRSRLHIRYRGFSIKNEFVIGYGLDNTQKYRNLPYIGRMIDS